MDNLAPKLDEKSEAVRIAEGIVKVKAMIDTVKPLYNLVEELTLQLKAIVGTDVEVEIPEQVFMFNERAMFTAAQKVSVVDNFETKNTVFRPVGVKRYEAKFDIKPVGDTNVTK